MSRHYSAAALPVIMLMMPVLSFSQTASSSFRKLSCPEKWWVLLHPFAAGKAYRITVEARNITKEVEKDSVLDHDADGGQVDAFRHSYWMARMSQEMCRRKVYRLGKAHERGNYLDFQKRRTGEEIFSDSIAGAMDLYNNHVGIETGHAYRSLPQKELMELLIKKILNGEMKIVKKDAEGNSLTCDGQVIELKNYGGIWNIPRCLISSGKK